MNVVIRRQTSPEKWEENEVDDDGTARLLSDEFALPFI
jgi:hypothetical protein